MEAVFDHGIVAVCGSVGKESSNDRSPYPSLWPRRCFLTRRILLADDHQIVRRGLKSLIQGLGPEWEICGEAENGKEAVEKTLEARPDLVILDISMPVQNGLEAAREIRQRSPQTKILILSMHDSPHMKEEARKAGADAYVVKSAASEDLRDAMGRVLSHTS